MLIKKWKIRIQSDGRPAITFPSGRQDGVLLPEAEDIELSDEGLIFSISRRGTTIRYECPFNELGYTAPPTPIAQLQSMRCVTTVPQGHILIFLYEFICGLLTEATPCKRQVLFHIFWQLIFHKKRQLIFHTYLVFDTHGVIRGLFVN